MFGDENALRRLGHRTGWRRGKFIAELHIPEDAPITYQGPDHKNHWLLYGRDGEMLSADGAALLLSCVRRVVYGPTDGRCAG